MPGNNPWAGLSPEEYEARAAKIGASHRARWAKINKQRRREITAPKIAAMVSAVRANGSHADCTHDTTPRARARCRAARKRAAS